RHASTCDSPPARRPRSRTWPMASPRSRIANRCARRSPRRRTRWCSPTRSRRRARRARWRSAAERNSCTAARRTAMPCTWRNVELRGPGGADRTAQFFTALLLPGFLRLRVVGAVDFGALDEAVAVLVVLVELRGDVRVGRGFGLRDLA